MKLLLCKDCQDIFKLNYDKRTCKCGKVAGKYIDKLNAIYSGENAIPIGFSNPTLVDAVINQPNQGMGKDFIAFVIPKNVNTLKKVDKI